MTINLIIKLLPFLIDLLYIVIKLLNLTGSITRASTNSGLHFITNAGIAASRKRKITHADLQLPP